MGQPVVLAHLDPLRVDEDHPHLVGRGPHEDRRDERVEAAGLAGASRTGDEQVRHRRQVHQHGLAVDVPTDRHLEGVAGPLGLGRGEDVAERHDLSVDVRHLHADGLAPGDRGQDAHVRGCHRVRDVLVEAGDAGHLHTRAQLQLVARDRRADHHAHQLRLDAVLGQRVFENPTCRLDSGLVDRLGAAALEETEGRELPRGALDRRPELEVELRAWAGVDLGQLRGAGRTDAGLGDRAVDVLVEHVDQAAGVVVIQRDVDTRVALGCLVFAFVAEREEVEAGPPQGAADGGAGRPNAVRRRLGRHPHRDPGEHDQAGDDDRRQDERSSPGSDARGQRARHREPEQPAGARQVVRAGIEAGAAAAEVEQPRRRHRDEQAAHPQMRGGQRLGLDDHAVGVGPGGPPALHEEHADEDEERGRQEAAPAEGGAERRIEPVAHRPRSVRVDAHARDEPHAGAQQPGELAGVARQRRGEGAQDPVADGGGRRASLARRRPLGGRALGRRPLLGGRTGSLGRGHSAHNRTSSPTSHSGDPHRSFLRQREGKTAYRCRRNGVGGVYRRGWQVGQWVVPRASSTDRRSSVPQRRHGSPARP